MIKFLAYSGDTSRSAKYLLSQELPLIESMLEKGEIKESFIKDLLQTALKARPDIIELIIENKEFYEYGTPKGNFIPILHCYKPKPLNEKTKIFIIKNCTDLDSSGLGSAAFDYINKHYDVYNSEYCEKQELLGNLD